MSTKEEAEVRKLEAETAKIELDTQVAAAQLQVAQEERNLKAAEAQRVAAEASKVEIEAAYSSLGLQERRRESEYAAANDFYAHVYWFDQPVQAASVKNCIQALRSWDRLDPECDITVVFNSPGGSVIDGMALYDELVTLSKRGGGRHELTTVIRGYAASMAGILLQAGDIRVAGAESYLMIHEIQAGAGGKIGEIVDQVKFFEKICERVADIFVKRSEGKTSKVTFQKNWKRQDWWLDSTQALRQGFVDEIR